MFGEVALESSAGVPRSNKHGLALSLTELPHMGPWDPVLKGHHQH